jgi:hypothetical protein
VRGPPRARAYRAGRPLSAHHAFGIAVDLDGIADPGLPSGHGSGALPPTAVLVGTVGSWPNAPVTRELYDGDALVFSVAHVAGSGYLLTMPGYGRFLVAEDGSALLCEPESRDDWPEALTIHGLPLAATLRGFEPFHAAGVVRGGAALMITGPVTAGKSSLAAALVAGGADLLGDDVVAVDHELRAHPGPRRLSLREPEDGGDRLRPVRGRDGRARYEAPPARGPCPLRAVYVLDRGDGPAIAPLPASGLTLLAATYNLSVREPERLQRQLELAHAIAAAVPLYRLTVTPDRPARDLAAVVAEHFAP